MEVWSGKYPTPSVVSVLALMGLLFHAQLHPFNPDHFPYQSLRVDVGELDYIGPDTFYVMDHVNVTVLKKPEMLVVSKATKRPLVTILVLSAPRNFEERQCTRHDVGSNLQEPYNLVFLIGEVHDCDLQHKLDQEHVDHKDLLQLSLEESYRNLSYKTLTGLAWTSTVTNSDWIVKVDDDIDVDWTSFVSELDNVPEESGLACHVILKNFFPERHNAGINHKLYLNYSEWPSDMAFPPYCNGWVYAVRSEYAGQLVAASRVTPKLFIDDLYVTGILRQRLDIPLYQIGWTPWYDRIFGCSLLNLFRVHYLENMAYPRNEWPWGILDLTHRYFLNKVVGTGL